jgi:hypothetical protein
MVSVEAWLEEEAGLDTIAVGVMEDKLAVECAAFERRAADLAELQSQLQRRRRQLQQLLGGGSAEAEERVLSTREEQEQQLVQELQMSREHVSRWRDGVAIAAKHSEGCAAARRLVLDATTAGVQALKTKMVVKMGGQMQVSICTLATG